MFGLTPKMQELYGGKLQELLTFTLMQQFWITQKTFVGPNWVLWRS